VARVSIRLSVYSWRPSPCRERRVCALDRDARSALQVIESSTWSGLLGVHGAREREQSVGQRRLAVIDGARSRSYGFWRTHRLVNTRRLRVIGRPEDQKRSAGGTAARRVWSGNGAGFEHSWGAGGVSNVGPDADVGADDAVAQHRALPDLGALSQSTEPSTRAPAAMRVALAEGRSRSNARAHLHGGLAPMTAGPPARAGGTNALGSIQAAVAQSRRCSGVLPGRRAGEPARAIGAGLPMSRQSPRW